MAESIAFSQNADRQTVYKEIVPQIDALVAGETDLTANLANIAAVLKEAFDFFWVGFYLKKDGQLVLGPFRGRSLARESISTRAFAVELTRRDKRRSFQMLMSSRSILYAALRQGPRSWCRSSTAAARFLAFWMSTATD